jgi:uncharacterized protein
VIAAVGATSVKDMGNVLAELKAKFADQMDFASQAGLLRGCWGEKR